MQAQAQTQALNRKSTIGHANKSKVQLRCIMNPRYDFTISGALIAGAETANKILKIRTFQREFPHISAVFK